MDIDEPTEKDRSDEYDQGEFTNRFDDVDGDDSKVNMTGRLTKAISKVLIKDASRVNETELKIIQEQVEPLVNPNTPSVEVMPKEVLSQLKVDQR